MNDFEMIEMDRDYWKTEAENLQRRLVFWETKANRLVTEFAAMATVIIRKGHYDTCSHSLSAEYDCDCGHDKLRNWLEGTIWNQGII